MTAATLQTVLWAGAARPGFRRVAAPGLDCAAPSQIHVRKSMNESCDTPVFPVFTTDRPTWRPLERSP